MKPVKVLMVCLGNICRSPTAQGVFAQRVAERGLSARIEIDSAGTSAWHLDEAPDARSQIAAAQRGYDLSDQRGRQVAQADFDTFDYILAMDTANLADLRRVCPPHFSGHLGLFLDFAGDAAHREVPDPYHGGDAGFDLVLDLVEQAADGLLDHIERTDLR